jgi:hypothetical protein
MDGAGIAASRTTSWICNAAGHQSRCSGGERMSADGSWKVTMSTPMGKQEMTLELKEDGGADRHDVGRHGA